jgi:predicted nucleic acid-binding protein
MYIFDSGAIAILLKRLKDKSIEVLGGETILDLTRYELGNALWKECALKKLINPEEAADRAGDMAKMLEILNVEEIASIKDFRQVMELAVKLRLTFYDASYLYMAKSKGLTFVTEDRELYRKAGEAMLNAVIVSDFLKTSYKLGETR